MIKIALVGEIGSGKSYIAKLFKYPIFNADKEVANIYKKDKACFTKLKKKLPNYFSSFPIKKKELINSILDKKKNLKYISNIIHPIIRKKLKKFIYLNKKKKIVILDIPLYLENNINRKNDIVIFIHSKKMDIAKRLIKRKGYNKFLVGKFKKIQLPIEKKKKKSKFIIKNDFTKRTAEKYVKNILNKILK
jgi:dephospho-CoA kinase